MFFLELIAQSLVQGSIYALIALGLTLVYGLLRILHVAHASLFTLGAYVGVLTYNATGSLALTLLAAMLVSGLSGVAMFRLAYKPLLKQPPHVALIASIGLFIAAEECFRIVKSFVPVCVRVTVAFSCLRVSNNPSGRPTVNPRPITVTSAPLVLIP
jgi:branched-chain amino acid transport system permease protein